MDCLGQFVGEKMYPFRIYKNMCIRFFLFKWSAPKAAFSIRYVNVFPSIRMQMFSAMTPRLSQHTFSVFSFPNFGTPTKEGAFRPVIQEIILNGAPLSIGVWSMVNALTVVDYWKRLNSIIASNSCNALVFGTKLHWSKLVIGSLFWIEPNTTIYLLKP